MPDSPPLTTALGTILQPLALKALNAATDGDEVDGIGLLGTVQARPTWRPGFPAITYVKNRLIHVFAKPFA